MDHVNFKLFFALLLSALLVFQTINVQNVRAYETPCYDGGPLYDEQQENLTFKCCPADQQVSQIRSTPQPTNNTTTTQESNGTAKNLIVMFAPSQKGIALAAIEKYKFGGMAMTGDPGSGRVFDKAFFDEATTKAGGNFIPMADEEGGLVDRYGIAPKTAAQLGAAGSVQATKAEGARIGAEMVGFGLSVDFAPVLDIDHGMANHLGGTRAFGNNKTTVIEHAGAFAEGLNSAGIKPTYKHFPGLGRATADTDRGAAGLTYSELANEDLEPFKALANKNSGLVMLSNAKISDLGGGLPAPINSQLIEKLRGEVGFTGTIITDDLTVLSRWYGADLPTLVSGSSKAGADLMLFQWPGDDVMDQIIEKLNGEVPPERTQEANGRQTAESSTSAAASTPTNPQSGAAGSQGTACCPVGGPTPAPAASNGGGGGCGEKQTGSKANEDQIWSFFNNKFKEAGYDNPVDAENATAGIMGNWKQESGFSPDRHNQPSPGGGCTGASGPVTGTVGLGIAQWCGSRQTDLQNFARDRNTDISCLGTQLEFTWQEMQSRNLPAGMKGQSAAQAASIFNLGGNGASGFEVGANNDARMNFATELVAAHSGRAASTLTSNGNSSTPDPNCANASSASNNLANTSTTPVPADCASLVTEVKRLRDQGKFKSINGTANLDKDLNTCTDGPIECGTDGGRGGVTPQLLSAFVKVIRHIDSKGLGQVDIASMNTGHGCDQAMHPQGKAVDFWNCYELDSDPKCKEIFTYITDHAGDLGVRQVIHNVPPSGYSCGQGPVTCMSDHHNEIHMGL